MWIFCFFGKEKTKDNGRYIFSAPRAEAIYNEDEMLLRGSIHAAELEQCVVV